MYIALTILNSRNKTLFGSDLIRQLFLSKFGKTPFLLNKLPDHKGFCFYLEFGPLFSSPFPIPAIQMTIQ